LNKEVVLRSLIAVIILILIVSNFGCGEKPENSEVKIDSIVIVPQKQINLWNGSDFSGLKFFLEDETVDPGTVWMIKDGVIHCTGIPAGYIYTKNEYSNYILQLEWRWAEEPGNSGVLLHTQLPDKVWPKCIEAQLKSGNAGDFYLIGGTSIKEQKDKSKRRVEKLGASSEKTAGEWNSYHITCKGDSIILRVNDVLQNMGSGASVTSGKICLQSEGKPIEFRNIYLLPVM
jgi:hypothetical protein